MDTVTALNLPFFLALFILIVFPLGMLLLIWIVYVMEQAEPGYRSAIPDALRLFRELFTFVRRAALCLTLIQTLIWAAAPVESSFFTTLDQLNVHPWISAIYST